MPVKPRYFSRHLSHLQSCLPSHHLSRNLHGLLLAALLTALAPAALAQDQLTTTLFDQVDERFEQARAEQVPLLAPSAWSDAERAYERARSNLERGRSLQQTRQLITDALAHLDDATEQTRLARVTFNNTLTARVLARNANADQHATRSWDDAEATFARAITTLERGRSDRARALADDASVAFRNTELEAIQNALLNDTRALVADIAGDRSLRVDRHAPRTLSTAQGTLAAAEQALVEDRYDADRALTLAAQASEQAQHAAHLAMLALRANSRDETLEDVLLELEAPVIDIAHALKITPQLASGTQPIASAVIERIHADQRALADAQLGLTERDERIASLERVAGGAMQESLALSALLEEQAQRRGRLERIETLFSRDEARVLRSGSDIIVRLVGLSFASGSAQLQSEHIALLDKALEAITIFPDAVVTVEGHTDSVGSFDLNLNLSQQRADAVRRHLLDNSRLSANQVAAMGHGDGQPIANNDTADGRARNRRIDLIISSVDR